MSCCGQCGGEGHSQTESKAEETNEDLASGTVQPQEPAKAEE
ncbi:hypothetical protein [Thalassotalea piscium]|uniref:Uncharacterized protein n=1 Tax=Thalassotalea piscium TaxID=1230533 RepID=A0A7X0NIN2_9GAMM|nr:hypothetical protein [Thalassotalea piscium]MBB6543981.1 hypothetical protein [Thalassotalea piscium]